MGGSVALRAYLRSRATPSELALFEAEEAGAPVTLPSEAEVAPLGPQAIPPVSGASAPFLTSRAASGPAPWTAAPASISTLHEPSYAPQPPTAAVAAPFMSLPVAAAAPSTVGSFESTIGSARGSGVGGGGGGISSRKSPAADAASADRVDAAARHVVTAAQADSAQSAWVFALREALAAGKLELLPAAFAPTGVLLKEGIPLQVRRASRCAIAR
jgi:hypothetical protein